MRPKRFCNSAAPHLAFRDVSGNPNLGFESAMAHWPVQVSPRPGPMRKWPNFALLLAPTGAACATCQKHMQAMKVGEQAFFYHSNEGKNGRSVEVCKAAPTMPRPKLGMADTAPVASPCLVTSEEGEGDSPWPIRRGHSVTALRSACDRRRVGHRLQVWRSLAEGREAKARRSARGRARSCQPTKPRPRSRAPS